MITEFNKINVETEEGKLLFAAIMKIKDQYQWNDGTTEILQQLNELKDRIFLIMERT